MPESPLYPSANTVSLSEPSSAPVRRKLPDTCKAVIHKFNICGHDGFLTVGFFEDGTPGELFLTMPNERATIGGLLDSIALLTSLALQYGIPLDVLVSRFADMSFEPAGFTAHPDIRKVSSIVAYVFRWLALQEATCVATDNTKSGQASEVPASEFVPSSPSAAY